MGPVRPHLPRRTVPTGLVEGSDGRRRCSWCIGSDEYVSYHDDEWGRPVPDAAAVLDVQDDHLDGCWARQDCEADREVAVIPSLR